ncbi:MAG: BlaI/MecI/CopY family transcriptional regulator [Bacteroidota bacterium]
MTPSDAELDILRVIWANEPISVREVHEAISAQKDVGYTTTLKQMQRMVEKGLVQRTGSGKKHSYQAIIRENEVQTSLFDRLKNAAFKGSAIDLALHALGQSQPTEDELTQLEEWLQQKRNQQDS